MVLSTDDRGASGVLATLLLTGIVAITVTVSGAAVLDSSLDGTAAGHVVGQVDVEANTTAETVTIRHLGGDSFERDTVTVVLKSESDSARVPLTDGTIDGGERFVPSSTWHYNYSGVLDGDLKRVYVVYTPANDVLDVERFTNTTAPGSDDDGTNGDGVLRVNISDRTNNQPGNSGYAIYWIEAAVDASTDVENITVEFTNLDANGNAPHNTGRVTIDGASGGACYVNKHMEDDQIAINATAYTPDGAALDHRNLTDVADGSEPGDDDDVDTDTAPSGECERSATGDDGPGPVEDPGFAYVDANGDWQYDPNVKHEKKVETEQLEKKFSTNKGRLIVPASVSVEAAEGTTLSANGIYLAGKITHPIWGDTSNIVLNARGGTLWLDGATVSDEKSRSDISISGTSVRANGASVSADGAVSVTASGGVIDFADSSITVTKGGKDVALAATDGDINLSGATLSATQKDGTNTNDNHLTATVNSEYAVIVDGATFIDDDDKLNVKPNDASTNRSKTT